MGPGAIKTVITSLKLMRVSCFEAIEQIFSKDNRKKIPKKTIK
jgi:hypothetical protein